MTDFELYLVKWLLNSGEDTCSVCAYCTPIQQQGLCKNYANNHIPDDNVCFDGIKAYFEQMRNKA